MESIRQDQNCERYQQMSQRCVQIVWQLIETIAHAIPVKFPTRSGNTLLQHSARATIHACKLQLSLAPLYLSLSLARYLSCRRRANSLYYFPSVSRTHATRIARAHALRSTQRLRKKASDYLKLSTSSCSVLTWLIHLSRKRHHATPDNRFVSLVDRLLKELQSKSVEGIPSPQCMECLSHFLAWVRV